MLNGLSPENIVANQRQSSLALRTPSRRDRLLSALRKPAKVVRDPYPMIPYMGILHGAIGENLSEFLQGSESAEQALSDIEAAYIAAAREQGFL